MSHVDSPSPVTHVSLCAGYGGIDLGLHRAIRNLRTIAVSEIEAFACANLVAKMEAGLLDPAPIWTNLKTFPWAEFRDRVDILSGGYPCQPFSAAGKRLGAEDPRHLWPFISAGIAAMRPSACFFENVDGHISMGLPDVIEDLGRLGYRATWCVASASECGAPHQRKRVFILAHRHGERGQLPDWWRGPAEQVPVGYGEAWRDGAMAHAGGTRTDARATQMRTWDDTAGQPSHSWPSRPGEQQFAWEPPRVVADSKRAERRPDYIGTSGQGHQEASGARACGEAMVDATSEGPQERSSRSHDSPIQAAQCGSGGEGDRETQPSLGGNPARTAHRLDNAELYTTCDNRTDELRLLGNGVVPACAERAFRLLVGELMEHQP